MEDKLDELELRFDDWLQTIMDVLRVPMPKIALSENAGQIGDYTLEDYKQIVDDAINNHLSKVNPHELTLEQLDLFDQTEIYNHLSMYQSKFNIPLTLIQNMDGKISVNWGSNTVTFSKITPTILGSKIDVSGQTLNLISDNEQYVILNLTMGTVDFSGSYSISATPTVSFTKIPVAKIIKSTSTIQTRVIVRIGENELSRIPMGTTIPVSDGNSQAGNGSIGSNWFTG